MMSTDPAMPYKRAVSEYLYGRWESVNGGRWTRRIVKRLKVGDIIAPEYNWCAKIMKIAPVWGKDDQFMIICDPNWIKDQYNYPETLASEIIGPHYFKANQRPLFWDGPDDIEEAFATRRF